MRHRVILGLLASCLLLAGGPRPAWAADGIEKRPLQFAKGTSAATVKGTVQGDRTIDYQLRARAGQTLSAELKSAHAGLAFNVLPPGSNDVALDGAIGLQRWTGALPSDGLYTLRTYLPRSAARRGEKAAYTLTVSIQGAAAAKPAAAAPDGGLEDASRRASEGRFNATGQIPCAQAESQPMGQCPFGVARAGGGTAVLVITLPSGRKRTVFFQAGAATFADLSQADGDMSFKASKTGDLFQIRAGRERYEVPEAAITGG